MFFWKLTIDFSSRIDGTLIHPQGIEARRRMGRRQSEALWYAPKMDEGRKRTLLIAASILVARKWDQLGGRPSPALDAAISDAIALAEKIMGRIDACAATPPDQSMTSNAGYPWKGRT